MERTFWDSSLPVSLTLWDTPVLFTPPLPLSQQERDLRWAKAYVSKNLSGLFLPFVNYLGRQKITLQGKDSLGNVNFVFFFFLCLLLRGIFGRVSKNNLAKYKLFPQGKK